VTGREFSPYKHVQLISAGSLLEEENELLKSVEWKPTNPGSVGNYR